MAYSKEFGNMHHFYYEINYIWDYFDDSSTRFIS